MLNKIVRYICVFIISLLGLNSLYAQSYQDTVGYRFSAKVIGDELVVDMFLSRLDVWNATPPALKNTLGMCDWALYITPVDIVKTLGNSGQPSSVKVHSGVFNNSNIDSTSSYDVSKLVFVRPEDAYNAVANEAKGTYGFSYSWDEIDGYLSFKVYYDPTWGGDYCWKFPEANVAYHFATFKWKLNEPIPATPIHIKWAYVENGAQNGKSTPLAIEYIDPFEEDVDLVPSTDLLPPELAMDTVVCANGADYAVNYNIDLPENADTCVWAVDNGATLVVSDSGRQVTVTYPSAGTYVLSVYAKNATEQSATVTKTITVKQAPTATLAQNVYACENEDATLTFTDLNPADATFTWLDSRKNVLASTGSVTTSTEGTYYLALQKDECTDTLQTEVQLHVVPSVTVSPVLTSCGTEDTLQVLASAGAVKWLQADKSSPASIYVNNAAGNSQIFWVYAQAGSCSSDTVRVEVQFNSKPIVDVASIQTSCNATTGELRYVSISDGTATWLDDSYAVIGGNNPQSVSVASGTSSAQYYLGVEGDGCGDTVSVTMLFNSKPIVDIATVQTSCDETTGDLQYVTVSGGTATWLDDSYAVIGGNNPQSVSVPTGTPSAQYYLGVEGDGCGDTIAVTMKFNSRPEVTVATVQTSCDTVGDLKAQTSDGVLHWLDKDGNALSSTRIYASGAGLQPYRVYAVGNGSSCYSDTTEVTMLFNSKPIVDIATVQTSCDATTGDLQYVTVSGGTATWLDDSYAVIGGNNPQSVSVASGTASAQYYLGVEGDGCGDTIAVTMKFNSRPEVTVATVQTSCDTVGDLKAQTSDGVLHWLDKDGNALTSTKVYASGAGSQPYRVYAVGNGSSCYSDTTEVTMLFKSKPIVDIATVQTSCDETTGDLQYVTVSGGTATWLDDSYAVIGGNNPQSVSVASGTPSAQYYLGVEGDGCGDTIAVTMKFSSRPEVTVATVQTSCDTVGDLKAQTSDGVLHWLDKDGNALTSTKVYASGAGSQPYRVYAVGNGSNCYSDTTEVTMLFKSKPIVDIATVQTSCDETTGDLQYVTVSGGTATWLDDSYAVIGGNNPQSVSVASGTPSAQYYLGVEGDGCGDTIAVTMKFSSRPEVTVATVQTSCDTVGDLKAQTSDGVLHWLDKDGNALSSTKVYASGAGLQPYRVYAVGNGSSCYSDTTEVTMLFNKIPKVTLQELYTSCTSDVQVEYSDLSGGTATWLDQNYAVLSNTNPYTIRNAAKGTYYLALDGNGCGDTLAVSVEPNKVPVLTVNPSGYTSCGTSEITLKTTSVSDPSAKIKWLKPDGTLLADGDNVRVTAGLTDGVYYAVATGEVNCADTVPFTIKLGTVPVLTISADGYTSCDDNVTLQLNSISDPTATVKWLDATGNVVATGNPALLTNAVAGNYGVTAQGSDPSCQSDTLTFPVSINTAPVFAVNDKYTSCDSNVVLALTSLSDPTAQVNWYKGNKLVASNTPAVLVGAESGTYKVEVTTDCSTESKTFTVGVETKPEITVGNFAACESNLQVSLTSNSDQSAVVEWYDEDRNLVALGNPTVLNNVVVGDYLVVATGKGCVSDTAYFKVNECNDSVYTLLATAAPDRICKSGAAQLEAVPGGGFNPVLYNWVPTTGLDDPTSATPVFTASVPGDYSFEVTASDGTTTLKDTVKVHVSDSTAPKLDALDAIYCYADELVAVDTGSVEAVSYIWYVNGVEQAGKTTNSLVWTKNGKDTVTVIGVSGDGCKSAPATVVLDIAEPIVLTTTPANGDVTQINIMDPVPAGTATASKGTPDYTYHWTLPAGVSLNGDGSSYGSFTPTDILYNFAVYATDANNCYSDTASWQVQVIGWTPLCMELKSLSGNEICDNAAALLKATLCDGVSCTGNAGCDQGSGGSYTYEWYKEGETTPVRTVTTNDPEDVLVVYPTAAVKYYVKIKDNGVNPPAFGVDSVSLTLKTASLPVADAGNDMTVMPGTQTVLTGSADLGTAPYRWLWFDGAQLMPGEDTLQFPRTQPLTVSTAYELFVVDANSCVSLPDTVEVKVDPDALKLVITPERDTLCGGAEELITLRDVKGTLSSSATYNWTVIPAGTAFVINTKGDSLRFTSGAAGNYVFAVEVTDGDKHIALRSDIVVLPGTAPDFTLALSGSQHCGGDTVKVIYADGATQALSYDWTIGGVTTTTTEPYYVLPNPTTTTEYAVKVAGKIEGCSAVEKEITAKIDPAPTVDAVLTDSCGQAVVEVQGVGATQNYTWNASQPGGEKQTRLNEATYTVQSAGDFYVEVTASNGVCSVTKRVEGTVHSRPVLGSWIFVPTLSIGVPIDLDAQVQATGGTPFTDAGSPYYKYHWFSGSSSAGDFMPKDTIETAGFYEYRETTMANYTYRVVAEDSNHCYSDTLVQKVTVMSDSLDVQLTSVYGEQICQNGAAMLIASVKGVYGLWDIRWYKENVAIDSLIQTDHFQDTLWVTEAGKYRVVINDQYNMGRDTLVLTVNNTLEAPVADAGPDMTIHSGSATALVGSATGGTAPYKWHWSPAALLDTPADTAYQYPQTAVLMENEKYQLYVTDENSCLSKPDSVEVKIDDVNGLCLSAKPEYDTLCLNNSVRWISEITCGTLSEHAVYSWEGTTSALTNLLDRKDTTEALFVANAPMAAGDYLYVVKVTDGGRVAAARVMIHVKAMAAPQLTFTDNADCMGDTLRVTNTGEAASSYTWMLDGITVSTTDDFFVAALRGRHEVKVYAEATNGCASDVETSVLKLGLRPPVQIVEEAMAIYQDSTLDLHMDQSDALWVDKDQFTVRWRPADLVDGDSTGLSMTSKPITDDAEFILWAADTINSVCQATDTVRAYIIPDSAHLDIDKDPASGNIVLKWDHTQLGHADSVRIMAVKWDGYAMNTAYSSRAVASAVVDSFMVNISQDTLEFFYIYASRYISELDRSYYSHSSDTVGYLRQWLRREPQGGGNARTNFNIIAYPFDMSSKGVKKADDLLSYIGLSRGMSMSTFNFGRQNWTTRSYVLSFSGGTNYELIPGQFYRVVIRDNDKELLFYGRLPLPYTYDILYTPASGVTTRYNYVLAPLNMIYCHTLSELGDQIPNIQTIYSWHFDNQDWATNRAQKPLNSWIRSGNQLIHPWSVVRVILKKNNPINGWGK